MAGVFPTAASPTAATVAPVAPPTGVGTFPSVSFAKEFVKVRFFEPHAARGINQRWLGMPRGVYFGFTPTTTPGSSILSLDVEVDHNFSLLKVPSEAEMLMVDIFTDQPVTLDFTAHSVFPVFVCAAANYRIDRPTQARIFTRASTAASVNEIVICKVDKVGSDLVVEADFPTTRQPPTAFEGQAYGYMQTGAVEDLAAASSAVVEVITARNSAQTGIHGSLSTRLASDMDGAAMADRLGLRLVNLISNIHEGRSGGTPNVSSSFTETGRDFAPTFTILPGGNESTEGAISDSARNFCFVIDAQTGQRIVDPNTKKGVYGIDTFFSASIGIGREIHFVNASTSVNGNGTNPFQLPLEEGDTVQGPDGLFYEIESFIDPDNAVLGAAFQGADDFIDNSIYRRWLLFLFTVGGGPFTLTAPTDIQFVFPCFFRTDRAIFDGYLFLKKDGERPQLPLATSSDAGKAILGASGGLVGSFRTIKNAGIAVGNDFHTLNFVSGGATNAGLGVANVSVVGDVGPIGPDTSKGDTGPSGPAGFGYGLLNSFELGPETTTTAIAGGLVSESFTHNWTSPSSVPTFAAIVPRSYAHVSGGWGTINGFQDGEKINISEITDVSQNETRITVQIIPEPFLGNTKLRGFMGASQ